MGQSLGTRIEVLGTLVCLGPVHVGGWGSSAEANLTVARDGTGRPVLPGTSIAGALRAYLADIDQFRGHGQRGELLDALFGHITPNSREGSPSWIRVDDAHLIGDDVIPVVRDGVGIDRRSASAAATYLYTRQVLPAGTRFALRLVADTPTTVADPGYPGGWPALVGDAVETLIAGLSRGRVPIGAGRGRGFGRVELRDVTERRADLSDPDGLVAWLTGTVPATSCQRVADNLPQDGGPPDGRLRITVIWRPVGPLLVRDSLSGTVVDTLPLTDTAADGTVRLLLPGSSIRGAVRAHAERIVRTLRHQDAPADMTGFAAALRQPPPGVDMLFGIAPSGDRASRDDAGPHTTAAVTGAGPAGGGTGWRGVLTVADCHSVGRISAQTWNDILTISPRPSDGSDTKNPKEEREERNIERDQTRSDLRHKLDDLRPSLALDVSDHVAIDRWTGGASDHRLFSVLDPESTVAWEPIHIDVDVARLDRQDRFTDAPATVLPLLLLVLRDLRDGWLSLGHGGTRGRGQIEVTGVTFDGTGLSRPWRSLAGQTLDTILADPSKDVIEAMTVWENLFQEAAA